MKRWTLMTGESSRNYWLYWVYQSSWEESHLVIFSQQREILAYQRRHYSQIGRGVAVNQPQDEQICKPNLLVWFTYFLSRGNHGGEDAHVLPGSGLERPPEAESWIHTSTRDWGGHQLLWQYVADQLDLWAWFIMDSPNCNINMELCLHAHRQTETHLC